MNKTCRGCNKELDNCTCNVLTTGKKLTTVNSLAIRELDRRLEAYANTCNLNQAHIKDLERINESHRIENGELRERIKELEKLIPTKEEAENLKWWQERTCPISERKATDIDCVNCSYGELPDSWCKSTLAKLQKIIDKRG